MSSTHLSALHAISRDVPYSRPSTPSLAPSAVGFVGIGAMGYYMARNLAKASIAPLVIWNRTPEKSDALQKDVGQDKIRIAQSVGQVAIECDVIISCLANDAAVKSIYEEFAKALAISPPTKNKIFVESSTIYPALAGELDKLIYNIPHARLITCPVWGAPPVADKAELLIAMSGDYRSKQQVAYLLVPFVGRKVFDLGGNLERAPTLKLIGNSMIIGLVELLAESLTLAEKSGIGYDNVHELLKELLPAPILVKYSEKMIHDNFNASTGFNIEGGIKDATHVRRLTAEHSSPMPIIDVAHQRLISTRAIHNSLKEKNSALPDTLDWSAIIAASRISAGLDGFDSAKHIARVQEDE